MSAFLRRSGQNPHRWATKGMKSKKELLAIKKHIKRKSAKAKHNRLLGIHNPHAAGADIGATEIYIAVSPDRLEMNVRCFGTFTQDLRAIVQWLREYKVTSVAMESTGVYWIPLYELLEQEGFEVYLVNARHVKNVPGRKSDVQDCQWLQYLHSVGLLRGSYRPAQDICAMRAISRYRDNLLHFGAQHLQHMQAALDQMNLRLHHVIADVSGLTGMAIIEAILAGERDPRQLAKLRDPRIKASQETIAKALEGNWRVEHLFVLGQALQSWKQVQQQLGRCDQKLEELSSQLEGKIDLANSPLPPSAKYCGREPRSKNQPNGPWREELLPPLWSRSDRGAGLKPRSRADTLCRAGSRLKRFSYSSPFRRLDGTLPRQCHHRRKSHPAWHTSQPPKNPTRLTSSCHQFAPQQNTLGRVFPPLTRSAGCTQSYHRHGSQAGTHHLALDHPPSRLR